MKSLLLVLLCMVPLSMLSQADSSTVIIFRNSGLVKSAAAVTIAVDGSAPIKLRNKSIHIWEVPKGKFVAETRLEKKVDRFTAHLRSADTLFLEVVIVAGRSGALPSSRYRARLQLLPERSGKAMMRSKWAEKAMAKLD